MSYPAYQSWNKYFCLTGKLFGIPIFSSIHKTIFHKAMVIFLKMLGDLSETYIIIEY